MTEEPVTVTVKLLDREFLVGQHRDAVVAGAARGVPDLAHLAVEIGHRRERAFALVGLAADQELAVEQLDGDGDGFFGHGAALNWRSRAPSDARSWPRPAHAPARCASAARRVRRPADRGRGAGWRFPRPAAAFFRWPHPARATARRARP